MTRVADSINETRARDGISHVFIVAGSAAVHLNMPSEEHPGSGKSIAIINSPALSHWKAVLNLAEN